MDSTCRRRKIHPNAILIAGRSRGWLLVCILLLSSATAVQGGLSYLLLKGTGSNCMSVDPLPGSTLEIQYHLPDLKLKDDLEGEKMQEELNTEGMDEIEASLLQRQREVAIKRARQGKDVSIAISQRSPFFQTTDTADSTQQQRERPRNQREQPTEKEGVIVFETSPSGGPVQICVHSLFATKKDPYAVGLRIQEKVDNSAEQIEKIAEQELQQKRKLTEQKQQVVGQAMEHLSAFSTEMIRAENLVRTILASADVVKKEEADFYEQSIRMEESVHFWPMLQLLCLFVAAWVQIRHVLNWMKSKHIY